MPLCSGVCDNGLYARVDVSEVVWDPEEDAHLPVPEPDVTTVAEFASTGEPYRRIWWTTSDMRMAPDDDDSDDSGTVDMCGSSESELEMSDKS